MNQIHLVPPERRSLTVGATTGLNEQYNRDPEVRWSCFEDPMFVFHSEHSLGWPLLTLIEMLHTGSWILSDVLSLERELENAMQTSQLSVNCGFFHHLHWVPLRRLAASVVAIFNDRPLIDLRQFAVP